MNASGLGTLAAVSTLAMAAAAIPYGYAPVRKRVQVADDRKSDTKARNKRKQQKESRRRNRG